MKINFYAALRQIVGDRTVDIEFIEGLTLRQLLLQLTTRFPQLQTELFDDKGDLLGRVNIFVNGRNASFLAEKLDTRLRPEDAVGIFPPVGGG